jgi:hypothetical protein
MAGVPTSLFDVCTVSLVKERKSPFRNPWVRRDVVTQTQPFDEYEFL